MGTNPKDAEDRDTLEKVLCPRLLRIQGVQPIPEVKMANLVYDNQRFRTLLHQIQLLQYNQEYLPLILWNPNQRCQPIQ